MREISLELYMYSSNTLQILEAGKFLRFMQTFSDQREVPMEQEIQNTLCIPTFTKIMKTWIALLHQTQHIILRVQLWEPDQHRRGTLLCPLLMRLQETILHRLIKQSMPLIQLALIEKQIASLTLLSQFPHRTLTSKISLELPFLSKSHVAGQNHILNSQ